MKARKAERYELHSEAVTVNVLCKLDGATGVPRYMAECYFWIRLAFELVD